MHFDNIDNGLISALSRNSRLPHRVLARKFGLSEGTIRHRLKRLVNDEVIRPELVVNYLKLGYPIEALIGLNVRLSNMKSVLNNLRDKENLVYVAVTAGSYSIMLWAIYESLSQLTNSVEQEILSIDGITHSETLISLKVAKRPWDNILEPQSFAKEVDILDKQIISALRQNVRISYANLAAKVGVSVPTARKRVQLLLHGGVVAFSLSYNPVKFGYPDSAILGLQVEPHKIQEVQRDLERNPRLRYVALTAGRFDIVVMTHFATREQLAAFLQDGLGRISGIEQAETLFVLQVVKRSFPEVLGAIP